MQATTCSGQGLSRGSLTGTGGDGRRWGRRRGSCRGCFSTKNLEHDGAARWALAFNGFAAVFHGFFDSIDNVLLRLAFDAVTFSHKRLALLEPFGQARQSGRNLRGGDSKRQLGKGNGEAGIHRKIIVYSKL